MRKVQLKINKNLVIKKNKMAKYVFAKRVLLWMLLSLFALVNWTEMDEDSIIETINSQVLTWTTTSRFKHYESGFYLHSHEISYGSGSGQQSVTGLESDNDAGSLWTVKEGNGEPLCLTGDRIKWGQKIRLEHMNTQKNLHTHTYKAPVSDRQEVSWYGNNGVGDSSDNWFIEWKDKPNGENVEGKTYFYLKHEITNAYLYAEKLSIFDNNNCRHCPIKGQLEISATNSKDNKALWRFVSGYFYSPTDKGTNDNAELKEDPGEFVDDYDEEDNRKIIFFNYN